MHEIVFEIFLYLLQMLLLVFSRIKRFNVSIRWLQFVIFGLVNSLPYALTLPSVWIPVMGVGVWVVPLIPRSLVTVTSCLCHCCVDSLLVGTSERRETIVALTCRMPSRHSSWMGREEVGAEAHVDQTLSLAYH